MIAISQQKKEELENEIVEIEREYLKVKGNDDADEHYLDGKSFCCRI